MPKKKKEKNKKINIIKNRLTKQNLFYFILSIIDIVFIIYCARHNYANYVTNPTEGTFFIGDSKDLLFGKNYIVIIFTCFIYIYLLLANRIFFNLKHTKKKMLKLFIAIFLINTVLFFIFTKRIY